jgi:hypothetical protein
VALAAVLLAYVLLARPRRHALAFLAAAAGSAIALAAYHHALYGFFDPRRVWGRRPELSPSLLPHGLQGLLLDQEFGLLPYAPLFVLFLFPGLAVLWRASRGGAATVLTLVATALLIAGAWPMWRGGLNPPARFLVPALPALALGVAAALRRGISAPAALLAGWSLWTGLAGGWEPRLVHRDRDGTAPLFRTLGGAEEWTRLLPGYVLEESARDRRSLAIVWATALAAAACGARRGGSRFGRALAGLVAAAAAASVASGARTGGRDAVRLVGRPAVEVPGWRGQSAAVAAWGPEALGWGPVFEPHRHPRGAELGARLPLAAGRYRLMLEAELPGPAARSVVSVHPEGRETAGPRDSAMRSVSGGLEGSFDVLEGEAAVTLRLSGGPLLIRRIRLAAQPRAGEDGPIGSGGHASGAPRQEP